jgi:hypothetical protein
LRTVQEGSGEVLGREMRGLNQDQLTELRRSNDPTTAASSTSRIASSTRSTAVSRRKSVEEAVTIVAFLRCCPVFENTTPAALAQVAEKLVRERFDAGSSVIRQGEEGDKFHLMRTGTVSVVRESGGVEDLEWLAHIEHEGLSLGRDGSARYFRHANACPELVRYDGWPGDLIRRRRSGCPFEYGSLHPSPRCFWPPLARPHNGRR